MGDRRASRAKAEPNLELPGLLGRRNRRRSRAETAVGPEEPHDTEPTAPLTAVPAVDPADRSAPPSAPPPAPSSAPPYAPATAPDDQAASPAEPTAPGGRRADRGAPRRADRGASRRTERRVPSPGRSARTAPSVSAGAASVAVGLVVGAVGALATWAAMQGCEALRGTSSCGGGPGLLILVAIFVAMVLLGGLLLAALRVPEPRGTSFLGVGVLAVVAMLVLGDALFSRWMFVVVPLVCAAAFGLGHWVTTRFVDTTEPGPDHDVR